MINKLVSVIEGLAFNDNDLKSLENILDKLNLTRHESVNDLINYIILDIHDLVLEKTTLDIDLEDIGLVDIVLFDNIYNVSTDNYLSGQIKVFGIDLIDIVIDYLKDNKDRYVITEVSLSLIGL